MSRKCERHNTFHVKCLQWSAYLLHKELIGRNSFTHLTWFKSTCNKARLKLLVSNSTAGRWCHATPTDQTEVEFFRIQRRYSISRSDFQTCSFGKQKSDCQTLVVTLVLSNLDYSNATLVGLPANLMNRLQSMLKAAARSIARLTSQTLLLVSTGYILPSKLSSNWRSLSTELFTGLCLCTCLIS